MVIIQIYVFSADPKAEESQQCQTCFKIKKMVNIAKYTF